MGKMLCIIKHNLMKQMRRYSFLIVIAMAIFLGVACVPGQMAGYQIFDMGGVRGVYNSAWLGSLGSLLSSIFLWLPGFYILRSQISEDRELKLGQILLATPISKLKYIASKAVSNFTVFMTLELIFLISFVTMQFIRGEEITISLLGYLAPLIITVPSLMIAAALTVFFDVVPFLRGVFGNIMIFIVWIVGTSLSVALPDNRYDLFGIGFILKGMIQGAQKYYPDINGNTGSFGYYPTSASTPTFVFDGNNYSSNMILSKLIWVAVAIVIVIISAIIFDRFKNTGLNKRIQVLGNSKEPSIKTAPSNIQDSMKLHPVKRKNQPALLQMIMGEVKILLPDSILWYLVTIASMVVCFILPQQFCLKWSYLILLLPITVWSAMGCHEKINQTEGIIFSSCSRKIKWFATLLAGFSITFLISLPILIRFGMAGNWVNVISWITGILFVSTLALLLGSLSNKKRFFEAAYIVLFYMGEVNGISSFDFLGITSNTSMIFGTLSLLMIGLGMLFIAGKRGNFK